VNRYPGCKKNNAGLAVAPFRCLRESAVLSTTEPCRAKGHGSRFGRCLVPVGACWLGFLLQPREIIVVDINANQEHSRPSRGTLLIALGVILFITAIVNWQAISAFLYIPQIKQAIGL
jgi:hypothetical protein